MSSLSPKVPSPATKEIPSPQELLSSREIEILTFMAVGRNIKWIAGHLKISVKTVESHRANFKAKLCGWLEDTDDADLVQYVLAAGLTKNKYCVAKPLAQATTPAPVKTVTPSMEQGRKDLISTSDRETEVLKCWASGMTLKETAQHLGLSQGTLSFYRTRLCGKFRLTRGEHKRTGLVNAIHYAISEGIVSLLFPKKKVRK